MRSRGGMASSCVILMLVLAASCSAGPLGPLPNVTSIDLGLKEGSCALGDVVYMPGDEFPGASPCERCSCADGNVQCAKQRCEPRPGCKAVHRPDHCCPTYQCECEQEGRVYDNGEKLVDPQDPCKVCYCQGGEVVCRRIACFVRDDCKPRLVPGRCCPEYDNCPLRGVTILPGLSPVIPSTSVVENIDSSELSSQQNEHIKQEITIKEITPVSEIPVITDVKIKEILPSPAMEVAEYSSSKSPLITREATSEKTINETSAKTETPPIIEPLISSPASPEPAMSNSSTETRNSNNPSKISLSTQDSIRSEMYSPVLTSIATMGAGPIMADIVPALLTTKPPIIEEEDLSVNDHNPLFPPIPDDLTVSSNHEDEIVQQEQNLDSEHIQDIHEIVGVSSSTTPTEATSVKDLLTTTIHFTTDSVSVTPQDLSSDISTLKESTLTTESSDRTSSRENSMLNLRSAIPTEILNVPALVGESVTEDVEESTETPVTDVYSSDSPPEIIIGPETVDVRKENINVPVLNVEKDFTSSTETDIPYSDSTYKPENDVTSSQESHEPTTNSISKSNIATEVTSQTELSSIPIETSDQNPHDASEKLAKDNNSTSTLNPALSDSSTTTKIVPVSSEEITVSKVDSIDNYDQSFENGETTEFIISSFSSSESATEPVELIKISSDKKKNSAIIEPPNARDNNVLTDLINLVGDVASISDHTESSELEHPTTGRTTISDSEELLPVNSGYKSKNNNRNQNSITEIPFKNKTPVGNKQKVVEIEDDDTDNLTDSPPPHDKVEPTTRRPIIDNVSDDMPINNTEKIGKKDIEIITQSYVPTINRRPTKVVMKKNTENSISEDVSTEDAFKLTTERNVNLVSETTVAPVFNGSSSELGERTVDDSDDTTTPAQ